MTAGQLPQLQNRDGVLQLRKLVNQLRRNLAAPAELRIAFGPVDLLTTGQTAAIPANASGWATRFVHIIPVTITGAQSVAPIIRMGSNATFDNVVPLTNLGVALVVDQIDPIAITLPVTLQANPVSFDVQTAASGPSVFTAMVYISGYFA